MHDDPVTREAKIDELLARILLADDIQRARGYAQQIIQLREMNRREVEEALADAS